MLPAEFEEAVREPRRRTPRSPVSLDVQLGPGGMSRAICKVTDLSRHGCRLQTYFSMQRGQTIWLTLPKLAPILAEVMWAEEFVAGCLFEAPLPKADHDALIARYGA